MAHQVDWTNFIVDTFVMQLKAEIPNEELFSELEQIMRTRAKGWSRTKQCDALNMSMATLDRRIKMLKKYYDLIQASYPELKLPKRRCSKEEDWMDSH